MTAAHYRRRQIGDAIRRHRAELVDGKGRVRVVETGALLPDVFDSAALAEAKCIDLAAAEIEALFAGPPQ